MLDYKIALSGTCIITLLVGCAEQRIADDVELPDCPVSLQSTETVEQFEYDMCVSESAIRTSSFTDDTEMLTKKASSDCITEYSRWTDVQMSKYDRSEQDIAKLKEFSLAISEAAAWRSLDKNWDVFVCGVLSTRYGLNG